MNSDIVDTSQPRLNAISIDVEDWFQVSNFRKAIQYNDWDKCESRIIPNICKILKAFQDHNTRGTFFILGWIAERYPEIVLAIKEQGHEIGSHGYAHQLVYEQGKRDFYEDVKKSKEVLERITNDKVRGYRAPSYSITTASLWAWEVLRELEFEYDSSLFPIAHDLYGIPSAPRDPFYINLNGGTKMVEIPLSTIRALGRNVPMAGGGYLRLFPYWFIKKSIQKINSNGKPAIIYLHPWEVDSGQPKVEDVDNFTKFRHYSNIEITEKKLRSLMGDFCFGTIIDLLRNTEVRKVWPDFPGSNSRPA